MSRYRIVQRRLSSPEGIAALQEALQSPGLQLPDYPVGDWVDCWYPQDDVVLADFYYAEAKFSVKRLTETLVQLECFLYCPNPFWYLLIGLIPEGYRPSRPQIIGGHGGAAGAGSCVEISPDGYVFLDYTDTNFIMIAGIYAL